MPHHVQPADAKLDKCAGRTGRQLISLCAPKSASLFVKFVARAAPAADSALSSQQYPQTPPAMAQSKGAPAGSSAGTWGAGSSAGPYNAGKGKGGAKGKNTGWIVRVVVGGCVWAVGGRVVVA